MTDKAILFAFGRWTRPILSVVSGIAERDGYEVFTATQPRELLGRFSSMQPDAIVPGSADAGDGWNRGA